MKKSITIKITGMQCISCEEKIADALKKKEGVVDAESSYEKSEVKITFEDSVISEKELINTIENAGYSIKQNKDSNTNFFALALGIITILILFYFVFSDIVSLDFTKIDSSTSITILFLIGLLTGFHCIGMCGGFVLSYSSRKDSSFFSHILYGSGKTLSYTLIGAFFGLVGSIFVFTDELRGYAALFAAVFLILYGIKMLDIFQQLRSFTLRAPSFITKFVSGNTKKDSSPLSIGLLNGLMIACGPLQAMYILAAGSGDIFIGAKLLFFFGLGTLLPMLSFGLIANLLSISLTHKIVKFSGVLVIFMGLLMLNNGFTLLGSGFFLDSAQNNIDSSGIIIEDGYQIIHMNVTYYGWEPNKFVLKKGVPVKWIINGKQISGCNNEIIVKDYNLRIPIKYGEQVIEFTPDKEGTIKWSCWMGMISGVFIVVDDFESNTLDLDVPVAPGSCNSCGGCSNSCLGG
ncbi:MAG: sulfite exporter TauE/SafE family protein [Candidatus ainarchaeum sp.]|nr:sulfite exporter TauE/SafE family protein [Candidatus ainarchaeum sp.]